ncbi:hypothetical protein RRF57_005833 [Xylaria bambusicola]|uniref:DUF7580 domain-containing protein n=1 Tax=Xylaria bambusicola TaxID=326684 RepID=A0AAN7UIH4_9PEZI
MRLTSLLTLMGMEVAGLVLGALPVAIMAVDFYCKGVKLVGAYSDYQQTLQGIRRNLFIQNQQLQATLGDIGLVKPTVLEIHQRLREVRPDCYHQFIDILEHMNSITSRLLEKLEIDSKGQPKWTSVEASRASWEWRRVKRSFGVKDRKQLFDELQHWNNALKNCLEPKREIASDHADPMTVELIQRFNIKYCDEARTNFRIIHETLATAWNNPCNAPRHPSNVELTWQHQGLNEIGKLQLSVPELGSHRESGYWQRVLISVDANRVNPTPNNSMAPNTSSTTRSTSTTSRKRKWRSTTKLGKVVSSNFKLAGSSAVPGSSIQLDCLQSNSNNLPSAQLITELCSLVKQKEWNGYLLHSETANNKIIFLKNVVSPCPRLSTLPLESVISDCHFRSGKSKQVAYARLSRKERLGIAAAAVWAVLVLCGTPWLDERPLGKEDIVLLVDTPMQGNSFERPKTCPSLLYTFHSRENRPNISSPISHSDSYQDNQIRHKTLFSLGVLLIELGLNKTFNQLRADNRTEAQSCGRSMLEDYEIANQVIQREELELEIGDSYAHAVQRCIQCHFLGRESTQNFSHAGFRKQFFTGVVAPVQATFDAQITSVHSL